MTETSKEYRLNKGRRVIESCKTLEQIEVAWNYIDRMNRMDVSSSTELWQECWDKKDSIVDEMIERERLKQAEYRSLLIKV
jgi:hypothetical protein